MAKKKIKLVFIEDEDLLRSLFSEVFLLDTEYEYEVASAMDVKSGLDKIRKETPDLVILDLILPYDKTVGSDREDLSEKMGLAVLKQAKSDPKYKNIPIIVFSNLSDVEMKKQVFEAGASEYLLKAETTPEKFLQIIKAALGKGK